MGNICTTIEMKKNELYLDHLLDQTYGYDTPKKIVELEKCLVFAQEHQMIKYQHVIEGELIRQKLRPLY